MIDAAGFKAWLATTDDTRPLKDYKTVLEGTAIFMEKLQDDSNILQCLREAGIDNVEAYSQGMQIYFERYPEKDDFA
jgi:hypothetical protein